MTRKRAIELVDQHIRMEFGMSVHDLGDDPEMCNIFDTVNDMEDEDEARKYIATEITMNFIETNVFG